MKIHRFLCERSQCIKRWFLGTKAAMMRGYRRAASLHKRKPIWHDNRTNPNGSSKWSKSMWEKKIRSDWVKAEKKKGLSCFFVDLLFFCRPPHCCWWLLVFWWLNPWWLLLTNERGDKDCKGVFFGFYSKMHYDCDETHLRDRRKLCSRCSFRIFCYFSLRF